MKLGKILGISAAVLGTTFVAMNIVAKKSKSTSVYDNNPEEKNPLEGKKVVFIENENEPENADGIRGHLEAVGEAEYVPTVYDKYFKRGIDIILSFGGLIALSPVFAVTALAIKIEDPGPVFFTQKRVGQSKEYFMLHKFRSMKMCTPHDVPTHMLDNPDQYITKIGRFIRKYSLDELPQIWDIFVGNMSVIGPRPGLWNQDLLTSERDKYGANDVKPGLTGLAQISGRDELEIPDKAKLDGVYSEALKKSSIGGFIMDCKMFFGSIFSVLKHEGIVEGGTGQLAREFNKTKQFDSISTDDFNDFDFDNRKYTYSVLMSVYKNDDPDFLSIALKSIYDDQTMKPDEIVVVFDGPLTDELYAVLNEFQVGKEDVVKYFPQDENHGLGEALRIGSEKCTCDYILRMDSDDISDPYRFERQIAYVETSCEQCRKFASVELKYHAIEMGFYNASLIVTESSCRIAFNLSSAVLCHNRTILVVKIGYSKRITWQIVEETFLCFQIILHILVVVEMVAGEVCEYSSCKFKPSGTLLSECVGTYFHESVFTPLFNHFCQHPIEGYCIGCGVCRRVCCTVYIVAYGR